MKNEEIEKLLKASLSSAEESPITEEEIREFLSEPAECPPGTVERVRAKLARKVLGDLHREPVRNLQGSWSFGQWLRAVRQKARLGVKDVAAALNNDQSFIERLETEKAFPWQFIVEEIADLISLFRVSMEALTQMTLRSLDLSKDLARRNDFSIPSGSRGMIDSHTHSASEHTETSQFDLPDLLLWLDEVRGELKRRQENQLL